MPEVSFCGETFALAERMSDLALMRFGRMASDGVDAESMEGLGAIYDLMEQAIDPSDWKRFQRVADRHRASTEQLMEVLGVAIAHSLGRPTGRPSDSSDGPSATEDSSTAASSSPVIARLEEQGRPDLALFVTRAQESQAV